MEKVLLGVENRKPVIYSLLTPQWPGVKGKISDLATV
jgi:hypothetical protein